jgi:non-homologous end joining protein Ku
MRHSGGVTSYCYSLSALNLVERGEPVLFFLLDTKAGHFEPSKFEDQYEDALKELLKKKQEGKPIERPGRPKPTNVANLMDALRQSVEASGASTAIKPKADAPARRTAHEKTEQPRLVAEATGPIAPA